MKYVIVFSELFWCFNFNKNSSTTLLWLVMLMSLHPEVQTKCQKEVDNNLGEKLPTIDEMNNLPYIVATLMEVQRFSAVGQTSLPHRLLQVRISK